VTGYTEVDPQLAETQVDSLTEVLSEEPSAKPRGRNHSEDARIYAGTFAFIVFPGFDKVVNLWLFDTPMGIFDLATSFWLVLKGLQPTKTAEPE